VAGDSTAKRRYLPYDAPLRKAIEVLNKGQTQKDLFTLASAANPAAPTATVARPAPAASASAPPSPPPARRP
jgi:hypothetical protein